MTAAATHCTTHLFIATLCLLTTVIIGCGSDRPATMPVRGRVTMDGQNMTAGRITFYPKAGRPATGQISGDGSYTLTTFKPGDGAVVGDHVVTIKATKVTGAPVAPMTFEDELKGGGTQPAAADTPTIEWIVPESYSRRETTPLKAVVEDRDNVQDFKIVSE